MERIAVHIFKFDLRLQNNEALSRGIDAAFENGYKMLFLFKVDDSKDFSKMTAYPANEIQARTLIASIKEINFKLNDSMVGFYEREDLFFEKLLKSNCVRVMQLSFEYSPHFWYRQVQNNIISLCQEHEVNCLITEGFNIFDLRA